MDRLMLAESHTSPEASDGRGWVAGRRRVEWALGGPQQGNECWLFSRGSLAITCRCFSLLPVCVFSGSPNSSPFSGEAHRKCLTGPDLAARIAVVVLRVMPLQ